MGGGVVGYRCGAFAGSAVVAGTQGAQGGRLAFQLRGLAVEHGRTGLMIRSVSSGAEFIADVCLSGRRHVAGGEFTSEVGEQGVHV